MAESDLAKRARELATIIADGDAIDATDRGILTAHLFASADALDSLEWRVESAEAALRHVLDGYTKAELAGCATRPDNGSMLSAAVHHFARFPQEPRCRCGDLPDHVVDAQCPVHGTEAAK